MKILHVTNTPPLPTWGGAMTFYRHFCERPDFDVRVITDDANVVNFNVPYNYMVIKKGRAWTRLSKTRFYQIPHSYSRIVGLLSIPEEVMKFASEYKPDAIFTVAGSWSWMAILAQKLAARLNIPLIGSFNDWWFYGGIYHERLSGLIERKFRKFYRDCDLAICTSEGMRQELGPHKNAVVLYPTGSRIESFRAFTPNDSLNFTVAFGGNLGDWYGKMLEELITAAKGSPIQFKIFGSNASWSPEFDAYVKSEGIFLGQVSFKELQREMEKVDGLLLLMGFEASSAIVEKTSFKTKFLDYLTFQKPILLWGPDYCSAVAVAKEFSSAEICTSDQAKDFLKIIQEVKGDSERQSRLVSNARRMYEERFNPDRLHQVLKDSLLALQK